MLRERSIQIAIEQRRQRRALIVFALALVVLIGFCGLYGLRLLMLQSPAIPVGKVADYVDQMRALGPNERAMLEGLNVERLIPDARERLAKRKT